MNTLSGCGLLSTIMYQSVSSKGYHPLLSPENFQNLANPGYIFLSNSWPPCFPGTLYFNKCLFNLPSASQYKMGGGGGGGTYPIEMTENYNMFWNKVYHEEWNRNNEKN